MHIMAGDAGHRRARLETAASLQKLDLIAMNIDMRVRARHRKFQVIAQHIAGLECQGGNKFDSYARMTQATDIHLPVPGEV